MRFDGFRSVRSLGLSPLCCLLSICKFLNETHAYLWFFFLLVLLISLTNNDWPCAAFLLVITDGQLYAQACESWEENVGCTYPSVCSHLLAFFSCYYSAARRWVSPTFLSIGSLEYSFVMYALILILFSLSSFFQHFFIDGSWVRLLQISFFRPSLKYPFVPRRFIL